MSSHAENFTHEARGEDMFDAYQEWLGIPVSEQPPNHFRLLWLGTETVDAEVVEAAARRHKNLLRDHLSGPHAEEARRILAEVSLACQTLRDPHHRSAYLRKLMPAPATSQHPRPKAQPLNRVVSHAASDQAAQPARIEVPFTDFESPSSNPFDSANVVVTSPTTHGHQEATPKRGNQAGRKTRSKASASLERAIESQAQGSTHAPKKSSTTAIAFIVLNVFLAIGFITFVLPRLKITRSTATTPSTQDSTGVQQAAAWNTKEATAVQNAPRPSAKVEPSTDNLPENTATPKNTPRPREWAPTAQATERSEPARADEPKSEEENKPEIKQAPEDDGAKEEAAEAATPASADGLFEDKGKEAVRLLGKEWPIRKFKDQCRYVELVRFVEDRPQQPAFLHVIVGQERSGHQVMHLWFPGLKDPRQSPYSVEVPLDGIPAKLKRSLKEGAELLTYGWFLDPPAPGGGMNVKRIQEDLRFRHFSDGGFGAEHLNKKRKFLVVNVDKRNEKQAKKIEVAPTWGRPDLFGDVDANVKIINRGKEAVMDVAVDLQLFVQNNGIPVAHRTIYVGRMPPGGTYQEVVELESRVPIEGFNPRLEVNSIHAVSEK